MSAPAEVAASEHRPGAEGTLLLVANYKPDVGFAWWLMEHFWVELATLGRARGLEPLLAYPVDGPVPAAIRSAGIPTIIETFPGRGLGNWFRALRFVRQHRVRAVYFTDRAFSHLFYLLMRLNGVRLIVNHDHTPGDRPPVNGLKGALKSIWRRVGALACDMQLCVSPIIRERAIANARIPAARLAVVQNGIEPFVCDGDGDGDASYAHRTLALPAHALVCMTVSRAERYKNIGFAIDVARECVVTRARRDLVFVFCGDGPDMEMFQAYARDAGVGDGFVFAGRRTDVRRLLCSSHLALHPSRGEAFSLAIIEYMSAGLALSVPDIPTVCQAVHHEQSGMVYRAGDVQSAADAICRLANDPALRTRVGAAASRTVAQDYSRRGMDAQFRDVMSALLDRSIG